MVIGYVIILYGSVIVISINIKPLFNFSFQNSNTWLFNCQIGHFNIESMEMNSLNAVIYITCKSWLTDSFESSIIWNSAWLMIISEQIVEVNNCSGVDQPLMPVGRFGKCLMLWFELIDNWFIIPRECQKITMFVFIKSLICADSIVEFWNGSVLGRWFCGDYFSGREESWLNGN